MTELTLEALAKRIEALELQLAAQAAGRSANANRKKDWRRVAGMFTHSELMRQIDAEGQAIREADRSAELEGHPE